MIDAVHPVLGETLDRGPRCVELEVHRRDLLLQFVAMAADSMFADMIVDEFAVLDEPSAITAAEVMSAFAADVGC